jgi:amino acid adenylation domain-containing protein
VMPPTMRVNDLIALLARKGVKVWTEGDQLRIRAPKGVLTPELRDLLTQHKGDMLRLLHKRTTVDASLPSIIPQPENRHQPFPLNDIQQAYWVGRTGGVELGNVTTHAYIEFEGSGIDIQRLTFALQKVIVRQDMLRVIILPTGEQQILADVPDYEIPVLDLSQKSAEEAAAGLEAVREEMSHQMLALDSWPLFDIRASRLSDGCLRIHFSIDLIITDFGSLHLFVKEWNHYYNHPDQPLPPLEISFRDFLLTELEIQRTELFKRSEQYWLDRIDTLPPKPQLPLAANPAAIEKPRFVRRHFVLEAGKWQALKARAQLAELTPSGLLLAAFAEVLGFWSQSSQFTINLTQYNRLPLHPQVNDIIGNSISVVLLAVDQTQGGTFLARAQEIQRQLWSDLNHNYMSGIRVLRELARKHRHTRSAIMPVVFTSILGLEALGKGYKSSEFGKMVYTISQTPQVWLDHQVLEQAGALATSWDAVEDLFPEGLLDNMFESYRQLLEQLSDNDSIWQATETVKLPARQVSIRETANDTDAPLSEEMLHTAFARQAQNNGDALAVISPSRTLTYRDLFEASNRLGRWLREAGALPGRPVAVVMEKGWEQIVGVMGVLASGAPYMPIDPHVPPNRLNFLLNKGEVRLALTQSHLDAGLAWPADVQRLAIDNCDLAVYDPGPLEPIQSPDDLAYVLFTSGSTGDPKGVMLDHRGPLNTLAFFNSRFAVGAQDRALALSALNFDLSVYDVFGMLSAGGALIMPEPGRLKDPAHWAELMAAHRVSVWNSVPTLMRMMVEHLASAPESVPPWLRLVIMSGDWIPVDLPDQIKAHWKGVRVIGAGGPTETSVWNVHYPIEAVDPAWTSIPYGRPIANNRYYVMDEQLRQRPEWVPGELIAEGVGLARGYWKDAEATNGKFIVHPETGKRLYKTGDLGRYLPDGNLEILGRVDFQVKIDGYRIELGEIEAALRDHPGVQEAVVSAVGEKHERRRLVAYIVPTGKEGVAADNGGAPHAADNFTGSAPRQAAPTKGDHASPTLSFARLAADAGDNGAAVLTDPLERVEFKIGQRGLRQPRPQDVMIDLPRRDFDQARAATYQARRTTRNFLSRAVPLERFSRFLDCLEQMKRDEWPLPKHLYPSAGSLYPVQTYLHVKAGRVENLAEATYYYDRAAHCLIQLEAGAQIAANCHVETNREVFEQAAFSIFLIAKLDAILPIYGKDLAFEFCLLEAGYMGQTLMMSAAEHGLGICPIGALDFAALRASFHLDSDHVLVHSLVGGREAPARPEASSKAAGEHGLEQKLRSYLRERIPEYMVPSLYVFLDALPLSANNKVDRQALPDPSAGRPVTQTEIVKPRTDVERDLAQIVCEVLGVESVGVHHTFFDLGGTSVDLVKIHGRIKARLGRDLRVVDLFRRPTISLLAEYISQGDDDQTQARIETEAARRREGRLRRRRRRMPGLEADE